MCFGFSIKSLFGGRSSKKPKSKGLGRSMGRRRTSTCQVPVLNAGAGPAYEREYPMMTPVNGSLASLASLASMDNRRPTLVERSVQHSNGHTPRELQGLHLLREQRLVGSTASSCSMTREARQPLRAYDKGKFPKTLRSSEYRPRK